MRPQVPLVLVQGEVVPAGRVVGLQERAEGGSWAQRGVHHAHSSVKSSTYNVQDGEGLVTWQLPRLYACA